VAELIKVFLYRTVGKGAKLIENSLDDLAWHMISQRNYEVGVAILIIEVATI
jgi:hypothetical protein